MDTIGQRLSWARAQAGFKTATDAARRFGWNENTYRSHENGARDPKPEIAKIYARAFKVDQNWLYMGTGGPEEFSGSQTETARQIMERINALAEEEQQKLLAIVDMLERK